MDLKTVEVLIEKMVREGKDQQERLRQLFDNQRTESDIWRIKHEAARKECDYLQDRVDDLEDRLELAVLSYEELMKLYNEIQKRKEVADKLCNNLGFFLLKDLGFFDIGINLWIPENRPRYTLSGPGIVFVNNGADVFSELTEVGSSKKKVRFCIFKCLPDGFEFCINQGNISNGIFVRREK